MLLITELFNQIFVENRENFTEEFGDYSLPLTIHYLVIIDNTHSVLNFIEFKYDP